MKFVLPTLFLLSSCATYDARYVKDQIPELVPLELVFPPETIEYLSISNQPIEKIYNEPVFEFYVVRELCSGIGIEPDNPDWEPHCIGISRFPVCVPKSDALDYGISLKTLKKAKLCNDI